MYEIHASQFYNEKMCTTGKKMCQKTYCFLSHNTTHQYQISRRLMLSKWDIIKKQPLLQEIYREPTIIPYKIGRSLKNTLVKAKLHNRNKMTKPKRSRVRPGNTFNISTYQLKVTYLHNIGAGEKLNAILDEPKRHSVQWDEWSRLVWAITS